MANRTTDGIADHNETAKQESVAEDALLAVVLAHILDLYSRSLEHKACIFEIETPFGKRSFSLHWVVGNVHSVIVYTKTDQSNILMLELSGLNDRRVRNGVAGSLETSRPIVPLFALPRSRERAGVRARPLAVPQRLLHCDAVRSTILRPQDERC